MKERLWLRPQAALGTSSGPARVPMAHNRHDVDRCGRTRELPFSSLWPTGTWSSILFTISTRSRRTTGMRRLRIVALGYGAAPVAWRRGRFRAGRDWPL